MSRLFISWMLCFIGIASFAQENSIDSLIIRSENGDEEAQYELFFCYLQGNGVENDTTLAIKYLTMAANNDNPDALFRLGNIYRYGYYGLPIWFSKVKECYFRASQLGHEIAQQELSQIFGKQDNNSVRNKVYKQTMKVAPETKQGNYANKKFEFMLK